MQFSVFLFIFAFDKNNTMNTKKYIRTSALYKLVGKRLKESNLFPNNILVDELTKYCVKHHWGEFSLSFARILLDYFYDCNENEMFGSTTLDRTILKPLKQDLTNIINTMYKEWFINIINTYPILKEQYFIGLMSAYPTKTTLEQAINIRKTNLSLLFSTTINYQATTFNRDFWHRLASLHEKLASINDVNKLCILYGIVD